MSRPDDRSTSPWLSAGIFFTFAPFGALIALVQPAPPGWLFALIFCIMSGAIALGWAEAFRRGGWWFLLIIPLIAGPVFLPEHLFGALAKTGLLSSGADLDLRIRQAIIIALAVIMLSAGYVFTVQYIRRQEAAVARSRAELDLAAGIHASLVPPLDVRAAGVHVTGLSRASTEMGGDLIDAVCTGPRLDVLLADVSGHGIKAGVIMGVLKGSLRTRLASGGNLGDVATDVNAALAELTTPGMFATFAAVRFEAGGTQAVLAGHLPILHRPRAGPPWRTIDNRHLPLAIEPTERFEPITLELAPGDELVLYTDGLTEIQSPGGEELGQDRLIAMLERHRAGDSVKWQEAVLAEVNRWGAALDDQSLVIVRVG